MTRRLPTLQDLYPIGEYWNRIASCTQPELTAGYVPESEHVKQQRRECFRLAVNDTICQSKGMKSRTETTGD